MDKYEQITVVGEGSYGLVMKCRHKETDQVVAIKKFLETEEDATVRRMALREIRMLKRLKHENLVAMIEVFRHRKRFYLVFEFLEGTVLDELEKQPSGLGEEKSRERIYQVTRAINYCHSNHIIHRDVKPENVLVSSQGVVKLCDFGFARLVSISGEPCTEYVATRWYRAPELLVGEVNYGAAVDIWAIGCLFAEMMTGDPIFPGDSDIDQLYLIVKMLGKPCGRHQHLMSKSSQLRGMVKSAASTESDLYKTFSNWSLYALQFLNCCMKMDPHERATSDELLKNAYFLHDRFPQKFLPVLREKVNSEFNSNPLLRKYKTEILMSTDKKEHEIVKAAPAASQRKMHYLAPGSQEQIRWKYTLAAESGTKRKFSCDIFNTSPSSLIENNCNNSNNLISLAKTSQRLNVVNKNTSQQQMAKQSSILNKGGGNAEMQMLEKSLESLAKFSNANEIGDEDLIETIELDKSSMCRSDNSSNVLHPSINNISFNKTPPIPPAPKKSPHLLHSLTMVKPNHVPLMSNARVGGQFLKKLERNVVVESMFGNHHHQQSESNHTLSTNWLNGYGSNVHSNKKRENRKSDIFTLPNLPGVTTSPNKNVKKKVVAEESPITVTPRLQSATSQKHSPTKASFLS